MRAQNGMPYESLITIVTRQYLRRQQKSEEELQKAEKTKEVEQKKSAGVKNYA
jgi:hypothetical protein